MITKLTDKQKDRMPFYAKKWTDIGLCTKRANRKKAEKWCRKAYEVAKLPPPKMIFWAESPLALLMMAKLIKVLAAKGYDTYTENPMGKVVASVVRSGVWLGVKSGVWSVVRSGVVSVVRSGVWSGVESGVKSGVASGVESGVWLGVKSGVSSSVRSGVRSGVESDLSSSVRSGELQAEWDQCTSWGQHDAAWLSFYDYLRHECGPDLEKLTEPLVPLTELAKETGWHLFYENIAILSEKPTELHRNEQGRLHNFDGPAIRWSDGYELYLYNGINIPYELATKKKLTKEDILGQENADIGRELVRKLGMKEVAKILKPKVLDTFKTKTGGKYELLAVDYNKRGDRPFLKMKCSSSKEVFILGSAPSTKKAKDAWIYLNNGYKPEELSVIWEA